MFSGPTFPRRSQWCLSAISKIVINWFHAVNETDLTFSWKKKSTLLLGFISNSAFSSFTHLLHRRLCRFLFFSFLFSCKRCSLETARLLSIHWQEQQEEDAKRLQEKLGFFVAWTSSTLLTSWFVSQLTRTLCRGQDQHSRLVLDKLNLCRGHRRSQPCRREICAKDKLNFSRLANL